MSDTAIAFAKERVANEVGGKPRKGTLVVVDYTKPSSEKRLTVVDLRSGRAKMNSRVAHGVNSGKLYATNFSNTVGSRKSSLGLYKISEEYRGKHGESYRLDGLDDNLNDNARRRAVVIHAADYATVDAMRENRHENFRLGRSAGCLALSDQDLEKLDRKLVRPAYVYAYAPSLAQLADHNPSLTSPPVARTAPEMMLASTRVSKSKPRPKPVLASAPAPAKEKTAVMRIPVRADKPAIARPATAPSRQSAYERSFQPVSLTNSPGGLFDER